MNPMDLKRGIDKAVSAVVSELKNLSKPCETSKKLSKWEQFLQTLTALWVN